MDRGSVELEHMVVEQGVRSSSWVRNLIRMM